MIKIKKMNNIYGINELEGSELIQGNTLIYASNGVMKTSFSDGLRDISSNVLPKDLFTNKNGEFEIIENNKMVTQNTENNELNLIVFDSKKSLSNVQRFEKNNLDKLLISDKLKERLEIEYENLRLILADLIMEIDVKIFNKKKSTYDFTGLNYIFSILLEKPSKSICRNLLNLIEFNAGNINEKIDGISYYDLYNEKTSVILSSENFEKNIKKIMENISKKIRDEIFIDNFTIENLEKIFDTLKKNNFFRAGHKLILGNRTFLQKDLEDLIEKINCILYENDETKNFMISNKKLFEKNAETKKFKKILEENKWILPCFSNVSKFRQDLIFLKLKEKILFLKNHENDIVECEERISQIISDSKKEEGLWKKILTKFEGIFQNNLFCISIENDIYCKLGLEFPQITFRLKKNNREIDELINNRFSAGEKRIISILNLMLEIEIKKMENKKFTIVLDDIADSFDYRNKYSIMQIIKEFSEIDNIQIIILTHNFDFFRTCRFILDCKLNSKLIASKTRDSILLSNFNNKQYLGYSFFRAWKKEKDIISIISCLPFIRNLYQLLDQKDEKRIDIFFHYTDELEGKKFFELFPYFKDFGVNFSESDYDFKLIDSLKENIEKLVGINKFNDPTSLKEKIFLSYCLRIFSDKFMFNLLKKNEKAKLNELKKSYNYSRKLFINTAVFMNNSQKLVIEKIFFHAPSFIHLNSFMYEPLIDIELSTLIELYKQLCNEIS